MGQPIGLDFVALMSLADVHGCDPVVTAMLLPYAETGFIRAANKETPINDQP